MSDTIVLSSFPILIIEDNNEEIITYTILTEEVPSISMK